MTEPTDPCADRDTFRHLSARLLRPRRPQLLRALQVMVPSAREVAPLLALDLAGRHAVLDASPPPYGDPKHEPTDSLELALAQCGLWNRPGTTLWLATHVPVPRRECTTPDCEPCRSRGWHPRFDSTSLYSTSYSRLGMLTLAADPVGTVATEGLARLSIERLNAMMWLSHEETEWSVLDRAEAPSLAPFDVLGELFNQVERDWLAQDGPPVLLPSRAPIPGLNPVWTDALSRLLIVWRLWDGCRALDGGATDSPYSTIPNPFTPLVDIVRAGYFPLDVGRTLRLVAPALDPSDAAAVPVPR